MYDLESQVRAIRTAIKGLQRERIEVSRKDIDAAEKHAITEDIDVEIGALEQAIQTIKVAEALKSQLRAFLA